jgi:hypothetical protein
MQVKRPLVSLESEPSRLGARQLVPRSAVRTRLHRIRLARHDAAAVGTKRKLGADAGGYDAPPSKLVNAGAAAQEVRRRASPCHSCRAAGGSCV